MQEFDSAPHVYPVAWTSFEQDAEGSHIKYS